MTDQKPEPAGFDNSWAAWKDRLGIGAVLIALLVLFLFMFTDVSLNFQCGVTDFLLMKCNRFNREFVPWDKYDKQHGKKSEFQLKGVRIVSWRRRPGGNEIRRPTMPTVGWSVTAQYIAPYGQGRLE